MHHFAQCWTTVSPMPARHGWTIRFLDNLGKICPQSIFIQFGLLGALLPYSIWH
jgi:hypothetical protein